jgi:hypothetical protein
MRAAFVLTKAVRSMVVASAIDGVNGAAVPVASEVTDESSATRLGLETALTTELDINRSTGLPSPL